MASSLLDLANNLSERIHRIKYIFEYYDKNLKDVKLNISIATVF